MDSLQNLKSRMRAVSSVKEIAKAMEVVAATKMRKSQEMALRTRPYAYASLALLGKLSRLGVLRHQLFSERKDPKTLVILIASDRGFAGKFNADTTKEFEKYAKENSPSFVVVIGKKAELYLKRKKIAVYRAFHGFGDFIKPEDTKDLSDIVINGFENELWDRVVVISTLFRSALKQEIIEREILPIQLSKIRKTIEETIPETGKYSETRKEFSEFTGYGQPSEYILEPSADETLRELIPHLVRTQIYQIILEANASEHSARRLAMKNASDNASDLSHDLIILYNKVRQANITNELIEITGTQSTLE